jgi:hypothetical protein
MAFLFRTTARRSTAVHGSGVFISPFRLTVRLKQMNKLSDLVRTVKFGGDQIILVTRPTRINGEIQTLELILQRLPAGS